MNRAYFYFHKLGYRRNPFGALTADEWANVAVLPTAVAPLLQPFTGNWQLLGPMGSGKTTSLLGLQVHLAAQGLRVTYEYLPEGQNCFVTGPDGWDVFLLDEAQRLKWRERRRLMQAVKNGRYRLIVSSHEDLTPLFARWRLPLTSVSLAATVSPAHYREVLNRRLAYFALPGMERVTLGETAVRFLFDTFGQNLRAAEYFLYEVWQRQETVTELSAEQLAALWQALREP